MHSPRERTRQQQRPIDLFEFTETERGQFWIFGNRDTRRDPSKDRHGKAGQGSQVIDRQGSLDGFQAWGDDAREPGRAFGGKRALDPFQIAQGNHSAGGGSECDATLERSTAGECIGVALIGNGCGARAWKVVNTTAVTVVGKKVSQASLEAAKADEAIAIASNSDRNSMRAG